MGYIHGPLIVGPLVTITDLYKSYIIVLYNLTPCRGYVINLYTDILI